MHAAFHTVGARCVPAPPETDQTRRKTAPDDKGTALSRRRSRCEDEAGHRSLFVLRTGNKSRVRDGYISESTFGHARTRPARTDASICRTNAIASDRACTPVPLQNLHGKGGGRRFESVRGLCKSPANRGCCINRRSEGGPSGRGSTMRPPVPRPEGVSGGLQFRRLRS